MKAIQVKSGDTMILSPSIADAIKECIRHEAKTISCGDFSIRVIIDYTLKPDEFYFVQEQR